MRPKDVTPAAPLSRPIASLPFQWGMTHQMKTQIVIIGGGAAGLELAKRLGTRFGRKHHDIILVDRNRTHVWKPLLHEIATGSLDANLDEVGYRGHCHRWGYRFLNGTLERIDRELRRVFLEPITDRQGRQIVGPHSVRYDYLVLAYGSVTNDFGTPGVADHCIFLDSRSQADDFRDQLLDQCLRVSRTMVADPNSDARVRVAIVGGGATGVELAAELYNAVDGLSYYGLEVFDRTRLEVWLIEAGPRVLPALPKRLADAASAALRQLGVHVLVDTTVVQATDEGLAASDGTVIRANLQVWAAGVKAVPIRGGLDGLLLTRAEQVVVTPKLQSIVDDRVFAVGDCASCHLPKRDLPVPPRAQAAHQMAITAYHNLCCLMTQRPLTDFVYRDRGSLISLSRYFSAASLMGALVGGKMILEGRIARLAYRSLYKVHLLAIHGWLRGLVLITTAWVSRIGRPRLKFH
jgi:NADH dehydrogenase